VASWTDANVSKESAALISQLHSAAYSKTPVTTVYRSPSRRHTQQDVNFEDKLSKKKKIIPTKSYGCTGRMAANIVFFSDADGC